MLIGMGQASEGQHPKHPHIGRVTRVAHRWKVVGMSAWRTQWAEARSAETRRKPECPSEACAPAPWGGPLWSPHRVWNTPTRPAGVHARPAGSPLTQAIDCLGVARFAVARSSRTSARRPDLGAPGRHTSMRGRCASDAPSERAEGQSALMAFTSLGRRAGPLVCAADAAGA